MREEEDRQKQKIMHAAGMYIDEDQAPMAGSSNNRNSSSNSNNDNGSTTGNGTGIASDSGLAGREQPQPQKEYLSSPPVSLPNGREGDLSDAAAGSQAEGDGAVVEHGHNDAPPGAASTSSNQACPDSERKGQEDADGGEGERVSHSGEVFGLDIEDDVRKRVLDLVRVVSGGAV